MTYRYYTSLVRRGLFEPPGLLRDAIRGTGWTITEDAALGLFSFQKMVMYRDLLLNEAKIAGHGLVRSLASSQADSPSHERFHSVPAGDELDEVQVPANSFSVQT